MLILEIGAGVALGLTLFQVVVTPILAFVEKVWHYKHESGGVIKA
jgi:hypothetical protein